MAVYTGSFAESTLCDGGMSTGIITAVLNCCTSSPKLDSSVNRPSHFHSDSNILPKASALQGYIHRNNGYCWKTICDNVNSTSVIKTRVITLQKSVKGNVSKIWHLSTNTEVTNYKKKPQSLKNAQKSQFYRMIFGQKAGYTYNAISYCLSDNRISSNIGMYFCWYESQKSLNCPVLWHVTKTPNNSYQHYYY